MLKKKLQVMESFHCSSSSLDALNKHRTSSIFVLPEAPLMSTTEVPEFPSPKLRSFGLMSEAGKRVRCHTDAGVLSLTSDAPSPSERRRRASLFEHIQRIRMPSFLKTKEKKTGFFKKIFGKLKEKLTRKKTVLITSLPDQTESIASQQKHDNSKLQPVELTYEQIITGKFESLHISIDRIEVCFAKFSLLILLFFCSFVLGRNI